MTNEDTRVARLEDQVRLLAAALGMRVTDPAEAVPAQILQLAREGKRLEAIRALRKASGLGLVAAARVVDAARRS